MTRDDRHGPDQSFSPRTSRHKGDQWQDEDPAPLDYIPAPWLIFAIAALPVVALGQYLFGDGKGW